MTQTNSQQTDDNDNNRTGPSSYIEKRKRLQLQLYSDDDDAVDEHEMGPPSSIRQEHQDDQEQYVPFVSAAKRLRMEREAALLSSNKSKSRKILASLSNGGGGSGTTSSIPLKREEEEPTLKDEETIPAQQDDELPNNNEQPSTGTTEAQSLLDEAAALKSKLESNYTESERKLLSQKEDEKRILREASQIQTNALRTASELAQGFTYKTPLRTSWTPPRKILSQTEAQWTSTRKKWHVLIEGTNCPPPIKHFRDMKLPPPILDALASKTIQKPTPIQMQGLPVALAGRDMVGIAFTGSGKTLTFALPLVMASLEEERRMPLMSGEGPIGFILAPSRELARQTFDAVNHFCNAFRGQTELRSALLIGGEDPKTQHSLFLSKGVHAVVATPGRIRDFLQRKKITLDNCRYCCLDEADRMLDLGFDEEVSEIMNHFRHQRQTLLFSATFPQKFRDFAKQTLVEPIVVNVGRAGAANLDVIQEVEYVKQEAKIVYLLECLQKTGPPVIIFCEKQKDVDDIHEYLLLKGVEAVSIHGGKDQEERNEAIKSYKEGRKDVLVATDVAAKGLDFSDIQHVINFDMPSEIENYVHRIGRTGRCGKTGVATTFINKSCEETTLLDLKHLLKEAHQRIPPVLMIMDDPLENAQMENAKMLENGGSGGVSGCAFCGGLGHSVIDCPKIDKDARRVAGGHKDAIASRGEGGYGGDW